MHSKWHQTSDFWQLLELTSSGLLISILEKLRLVSFDWSDNSIAMDVKMDGSALEKKKSSFKMLGLSLLFKFNWGSNVVSIAKSASKKNRALICSMKCFSPEVALYLYKWTI